MAHSESRLETPVPRENAGIQAAIVEMSDAWNRGDAHSFAMRFANNGSFTNIPSTVLSCRDAFEARHAQLFTALFKGSTNQFTIANLWFIRPDVAIAAVDADLTGFAVGHTRERRRRIAHQTSIGVCEGSRPLVDGVIPQLAVSAPPPQ